MRLLVTVFDVINYGGIVPYVEDLIAGMPDHVQTDLIMLRPSTRSSVRKTESAAEGAYGSKLKDATQAHVLYGWYGIRVIGYASKEGIREWKRVANSYDAIIHAVPVPRPDRDGWWRRIYRVGPPQIAVCHDANFRKRYPHLNELADTLRGVACVHPAALHNLEGYNGLRTLIPNPINLNRWHKLTPWDLREQRVFSGHVWKRWKRMDDVVQMIPHLHQTIEPVLSGDGIERRYMCSKDKCRAEYKGIWKKALYAGMNYRGMLNPRQVNGWLKRSRVMIDWSYSKSFQAAHVNRSVMEALNAGCLPLVTNENTDGWVFDTPLCVAKLPAATSPRKLAEFVEELMTSNMAELMISAGQKLLQDYFARTVVANKMLQFLDGKIVGDYGTVKAIAETKAYLPKFMAKFE